MERDPRKQLGSRYGGPHEGVGEGRVGDQQQPFESRPILHENPLTDVMGTPEEKTAIMAKGRAPIH